MSAQNKYGYRTPLGTAGGIADLAPYAVDTFINEEESGAMKFGAGVVRGSTPGKNIALPSADSEPADFEGIAVNSRTAEYDTDGRLRILKGASIGVMRYGRIYGLVAAGAEPEYGEPAYLITDGDEAGYFTSNEADGIAVKARFLGRTDSSANIAVIELFSQSQE